MPSQEEVLKALSAVRDPEIGKPITELDMVRSVEFGPDGEVRVEVLLTVPGCPLRTRIEQDVRAVLSGLPGVRSVEVRTGVMTEEQRQALVARLRGGRPATPTFWTEGRTAVLAVASGKGGVGKSTVTANLAVALARRGLSVGVLDVDVWGFSIPRMLGAAGELVGFGGMILPLEAHGVRVMSMGFFVGEDQPVIWRGPMLHKAVQQFLSDVYWGELDVLLADLPPGTGDVSISLAQLLPGACMLLVTTPQEAASRVATRAGKMASQTKMRLLGVVENMAAFVCPHCGHETEIFGAGGGEEIARSLGVPLLGRIPLDPRLRAASDRGEPLVLTDPESSPARAFLQVAEATAREIRRVRSLPLVQA